MGKSFMKINNQFFSKEQINEFTYIKVEGFLLYSYLLYEQSNRETVTATIRQIQAFLNRDYDKRPSVKYDENKSSKISCLKDKKTIMRYLKILEQRELIKIYNKESIEDKININNPIIIKCLYEDFTKGFTIISNELFVDKIHKIGSTGWAILCLLTNLHNNTYGGKYSQGFCNPSQAYIKNILKCGLNAVKGYTTLLEKQHLIKIEEQDKIEKGIDVYGNTIYEYTPNHYIVKNKDIENKYYIEFKNNKLKEDKKINENKEVK
jgi:hypothetical protein